jgi:hypothetical protein
MPNFYKNRLLLSGSTATVLPYGNTASRPAHPISGAIRFNTDVNSLEYWDGSSWVNVSTFVPNYTIDNFVGDGSTVTFTLSQAVANASQVIVFVGSTYQAPYLQGGGVSAYTLAGDQITFTGAPPANVAINVIVTG